MKFILSSIRSSLMGVGLFLVAATGLWAVQPATAASAATCGVHSGNPHSVAGVIVESRWLPYGGGAAREARGSMVEIWNSDPRVVADDATYGNILRLDGNNIPRAGAGIERGVFGQYNSACGDGHNVVLGEDQSSQRLMGVVNGNNVFDTGPGPWALDCDAFYFGVGNERFFSFTGYGVPQGARPGGAWSTVRTRTPNGFTTNITITYREPQPPDSPPQGQMEVTNCNVVSGWAYDRDNYNRSISVRVFVDTPPNPAFRQVVADGVRSPGAGLGVPGNHAFSVDLSARVMDGAAHTVEVFALGINSAGTPNGVNVSLGRVSIGPCRDYNLVPSADAAPDTIAIGQSPSFSYSVSKTGSTASPTVAVAIKQYVVLPGQVFNELAAPTNNVNGDCDTRFGPLCVSSTWSLPGGKMFPGGVTPLSNTSFVLVGSGAPYSDINTSTYPLGTRICQMLAVAPASATATSSVANRWSAPACVTLAKKPYVAIKNGDAWAGGSFGTAGVCSIAAESFTGSSTNFGTETYGAYVEYGLLALRTVKDFGSGGKPLSGGFGTKMTFANTPSLGNFQPASVSNYCLNDSLPYYSKKAVTSNINSAIPFSSFINSPGKTEGVYTTVAADTGLVTLTSGAAKITIGRGQHVVVIVTGDVLINKDIEFDNGPFTNLADIPSLTVISRTGNIRISQSVTRIDGFFQAHGQFVTCEEGGPGGSIGENSAVCLQPLTVNGAVSATEIIARRIYGGAISGGADLRNNPAEVFIMRPDVFLSQYGQAKNNNQLQDVDENELPPRY